MIAPPTALTIDAVLFEYFKKELKAWIDEDMERFMTDEIPLIQNDFYLMMSWHLGRALVMIVIQE